MADAQSGAGQAQPAAPAARSVGEIWPALSGFVGAIGAGIAFASMGQLGSAQLLVASYWLSAGATWQRLIPAAFVVALVLAAGLARRWGWVLAAAALAAQFALSNPSARVLSSLSDVLLAYAVTGGLVVGGALAAFGVADRLSRLGIGAGFTVGMVGGHLLLTAAYATAPADATAWWPGSLRYVPLGLCAIAALTWLVRAPGAAKEFDVPNPGGSPPGGAPGSPTRPWGPATAAVVVALAVIGLNMAMQALLDSFGRTGGSARRQDLIETMFQVGSLGIAVVAGIALAVYAYRRGGSLPARWVLVGLATGIAPNFTANGGVLWLGGSEPIWLTGAVAVVGALVGAGVSRSTAVPWDGLALVLLAVAAVLRSPQGRLEFAEQDMALRLAVVLLLGFVLATALTALSTQTTLRGVGGVGEVATLVGLGFVASVLASSVIFPASLIMNERGNLGVGPAVALGLAAVGVLGLYGLGRMARGIRRAIEAEARRESV